MFLAGAGVKPGFTYGETDELGFSVTEDKVHVHDLQATILHLLGLRPREADLSLPGPRLPPDRRARPSGEGDPRVDLALRPLSLHFAGDCCTMGMVVNRWSLVLRCLCD